MIVIVGLDIAQTTGFSVLNGEELIDYGKVEIKINEDCLSNKREELKRFRRKIKALITKYKPDVLVYETVYAGPNPKITARLNQLRGIALELPEMSITINSDHLSTIRSLVLGRGKHTKKDVFEWAVCRYNLNNLKFSTDNDITDSILLSFWGYLRYDSTAKEVESNEKRSKARSSTARKKERPTSEKGSFRKGPKTKK